MSNYERYQYLMQHDKNIVQLKEKVHKVVKEKKMSAVMNNSKWLKLQEGIGTLPFPPAYYDKLIHHDTEETPFSKWKTEPAWYGNWSNFWEEGLPIFFTIEWMAIRPKYSEYQGKLVPNKIYDATPELSQLLNTLSIPHEEDKGTFIIYGYK